jgi:hypothetical protein
MKVIGTSHFKLVECTYIPGRLDPGMLYYSKEYKTSSHLCACGCGQKVFLPIKEGEWSLSVDDGLPTITPSIQQRIGCKSHYIIQKGTAKLFT